MTRSAYPLQNPLQPLHLIFVHAISTVVGVHVAHDGKGFYVAPGTDALESGNEARKYVLEQAAQDRNLPGSVSYNFMMLFGYLAGGWVMVQSAMKAQALLAAGEGDPEFLKAKVMTSQFYCEQLLPRSQACLNAVLAGNSTIMDMPEEQF